MAGGQGGRGDGGQGRWGIELILGRELYESFICYG